MHLYAAVLAEYMRAARAAKAGKKDKPKSRHSDDDPLQGQMLVSSLYYITSYSDFTVYSVS